MHKCKGQKWLPMALWNQFTSFPNSILFFHNTFFSSFNLLIFFFLPLEILCSTVLSLFFTWALDHKWALHISRHFIIDMMFTEFATRHITWQKEVVLKHWYQPSCCFFKPRYNHCLRFGTISASLVIFYPSLSILIKPFVFSSSRAYKHTKTDLPAKQQSEKTAAEHIYRKCSLRARCIPKSWRRLKTKLRELLKVWEFSHQSKVKYEK